MALLILIGPPARIHRAVGVARAEFRQNFPIAHRVRSLDCHASEQLFQRCEREFPRIVAERMSPRAVHDPLRRVVYLLTCNVRVFKFGPKDERRECYVDSWRSGGPTLVRSNCHAMKQ